MCLSSGCKCKCLVIEGVDEERDEVYYQGSKCDDCKDEYPEAKE